MSPSNSGNNGTHGGEALPRLVRKAIDYAHTHAVVREMTRTLLARTARVADPYLPPDDPAEPPLQFVQELRRPVGARRRAIRVIVDGEQIPVILNPQGKADPDRERWLWGYVRGLVQDGVE